MQYQQTAKIHFHETKAAEQDAEIAQQDAAACGRGLAIAFRDLDVARREIASALQEAKSARQDAMTAHREAKLARQEVHTLRIEAARDLEARDALAQQVTALTAARGGGETLAPFLILRASIRPLCQHVAFRMICKKEVQQTRIESASLRKGAVYGSSGLGAQEPFDAAEHFADGRSMMSA